MNRHTGGYNYTFVIDMHSSDLIHNSCHHGHYIHITSYHIHPVFVLCMRIKAVLRLNHADDKPLQWRSHRDLGPPETRRVERTQVFRKEKEEGGLSSRK